MKYFRNKIRFSGKNKLFIFFIRVDEWYKLFVFFITVMRLRVGPQCTDVKGIRMAWFGSVSARSIYRNDTFIRNDRQKERNKNKKKLRSACYKIVESAFRDIIIYGLRSHCASHFDACNLSDRIVFATFPRLPEGKSTRMGGTV